MPTLCTKNSEASKALAVFFSARSLLSPGLWSVSEHAGDQGLGCTHRGPGLEKHPLACSWVAGSPFWWRSPWPSTAGWGSASTGGLPGRVRNRRASKGRRPPSLARRQAVRLGWRAWEQGEEPAASLSDRPRGLSGKGPPWLLRWPAGTTWRVRAVNGIA